MKDSRQPKVPTGFRFVPTERELIKYLQCKVMGQPLPCEGVIIDGIDIYDVENHPEKLIERQGKSNLIYVFTKLKKVSDNGKNFERRVGDCTWKGSNKGNNVVDDQGKIVGYTKNFSFRDRSNVKLGYNMKEFTLDPSMLQNAIIEFKDYALCRIYKNSKEEAAKSKSENFPEDEVLDASFYQNNQPYPDPDLHQLKNEAVPLLNSSQTSVLDSADHHGAISFGGDHMLEEESSGLDFIQNKPEEVQANNTQRFNYHPEFNWLIDLVTPPTNSSSFQLDGTFYSAQPSEISDPFPTIHHHQLLPPLLLPQDFSNICSPHQQYDPMMFPPAATATTLFPIGTDHEPNGATLQDAATSNTINGELQDQSRQYTTTSACCNIVDIDDRSKNGATIDPSSSTATATLQQQDERKRKIPDSETLSSLFKGNKMEMDQQPVAMDPILSNEPATATACHDEEINGDCAEFGSELATLLRGFVA